MNHEILKYMYIYKSFSFIVVNSIFGDIKSDSNPSCSRNVVVVKVGVKSDIFCWIYGSDPSKRERKGPNNTTTLFCQHSWICSFNILRTHEYAYV